MNRSCSVCHATNGATSESQIGPTTSEWQRLRDPIDWAERMWNHAEQMYEAAERMLVPWTELSTREMADLLVYLSNWPDREYGEPEFSLGDAGTGREIFNDHCKTCHTLGEREPNRVDLLGQDQLTTVVAYAAAMWNHAPDMVERGGDLPMLAPGDMRHLLAFLFAERYFAQTGDPERGARVYSAKDCGLCHEPAFEASDAPDLFRTEVRYSPITMVEALWNHGPSMLATFRERGIYWPLFENREMSDLIAYLNDRLARDDFTGPPSAAAVCWAAAGEAVSVR